MEVGKRRNRRGKRNELPRLHYVKEWWNGEIYNRKNEKNNGDEADLEQRKRKDICRRL